MPEPFIALDFTDGNDNTGSDGSLALMPFVKEKSTNTNDQGI